MNLNKLLKIFIFCPLAAALVSCERGESTVEEAQDLSRSEAILLLIDKSETRNNYTIANQFEEKIDNINLPSDPDADDALTGNAKGSMKIAQAFISDRAATRNPIYSYLWLNLAEAQGDKNAKNFKAKLSSEMTALERSLADEAFSLCVVKNGKILPENDCPLDEISVLTIGLRFMTDKPSINQNPS